MNKQAILYALVAAAVVGGLFFATSESKD